MQIYHSPSKNSIFNRCTRYFFILPSLIILMVLIVYPTYYLFKLALSNFDVTFMIQPVFNGFDNFIQIATDSYFWASLGNILIISGVAVTLEFIFGLGMALLLNNEEILGARFFRSLLIVPIMIPPVVIGLNFKLIFDNFGPINDLLQTIHLHRIDWLGNPFMAKISVIIADVWQWSSFLFIIFLAGLQAIPQYLYDSAKVDGASGWKVFYHIIWPMLVPSTTVALTFRIIDALKIFDVVYMLTNGGPSFATEVLSLYIYRTGFRFGSLGYAAALAITMLIFLTVIASLIVKGMNLRKRLEWEE